MFIFICKKIRKEPAIDIQKDLNQNLEKIKLINSEQLEELDSIKRHEIVYDSLAKVIKLLLN